MSFCCVVMLSQGGPGSCVVNKWSRTINPNLDVLWCFNVLNEDIFLVVFVFLITTREYNGTGMEYQRDMNGIHDEIYIMGLLLLAGLELFLFFHALRIVIPPDYFFFRGAETTSPNIYYDCKCSWFMLESLILFAQIDLNRSYIPALLGMWFHSLQFVLSRTLEILLASWSSLIGCKKIV